MARTSPADEYPYSLRPDWSSSSIAARSSSGGETWLGLGLGLELGLGSGLGLGLSLGLGLTLMSSSGGETFLQPVRGAYYLVLTTDYLLLSTYYLLAARARRGQRRPRLEARHLGEVSR